MSERDELRGDYFLTAGTDIGVDFAFAGHFHVTANTGAEFVQRSSHAEMCRSRRKSSQKLIEFGGILFTFVVLYEAVSWERVALLDGVRHRSDVAFGRFGHSLAVSWIFPSEGLQLRLKA